MSWANAPKGWMDEECLDWLARCGKQIKGFGVEVGSWRGRSTTATLHKMRDGAVLYAVDKWAGVPDDPKQDKYFANPEEVYQEFLERFAGPISAGRLIPLRMDSLEAAKFLRERHGEGFADFVFIDADHRYEAVKADIRAYIDLVRPGGRLAGHDYRTPMAVAYAVDDLLGSRVKLGPGSIWSVKKT